MMLDTLYSIHKLGFKLHYIWVPSRWRSLRWGESSWKELAADDNVGR